MEQQTKVQVEDVIANLRKLLSDAIYEGVVLRARIAALEREKVESKELANQ